MVLGGQMIRLVQTQLLVEKSQGFTNVGLYRISESVIAYAYLILNLQASVRSSIVGNWRVH